MTLVRWLRLLARYRFAIGVSRLHRFITVAIISIITQLLALVQHVRFSRRIDATSLPKPIFIIGHWRTGTTFLHELFSADERFLTPNAMQCMCPEHFLGSRPVIQILEMLLPANRPMDDIEVRWQAPQEDEFALLASGARSPYELFAFPRAHSRALAALDIESLGHRDQAAWRRIFTRFLKTVTFAQMRMRRIKGDDRPPSPFILLKSPTHTARLRMLERMFPQARFVHLTRDRHALFASSVSLWRALLATQSLHQAPEKAADGSDFNQALALEAFDALYANFERDRASLEADRLIDIDYGELTSAPMETMQRIYDFLGIELDEAAEQSLRQRIGAFQTYKATSHRLAPEEEKLVDQHWSHYPERYSALAAQPE